MKQNIIILGLKGSGALLAAAALASCSAGTAQPVTVQSPLKGILKVAVGTANIYGDDPTVAVTGTNVAAIYRQPAGGTLPGGTAALVNTPSISGPWTLPTQTGAANAYGATILTGPTSAEAGTGTMTGTPQQNPGAPSIPASTFGVSSGVTALGIEPYNYSAIGASTNFGVPDSYVPYYVPVYDALSTGDANRARPWGGPPAFDPDGTGEGTRDGKGYTSTVLGQEEGLDVFEVAPAAGTYTLSVAVPTSYSTGSTLPPASANISSTALLPAISSAALPTLDGAGGGSFPVTLPAGVTEAYVQIIDFGPTTTDAVSCNGTGVNPTYYTIFANATGSYTLPPLDGPISSTFTKQPTLCTPAQNQAASASSLAPGDPTPDGDSFTVQDYGFDYPAYEFSDHFPDNPNPTLTTAANGQADITISSSQFFTQPATATGGSVARGTRAQLAIVKARAKNF